MTENTALSYSSISGNMHDLELKNMVYREQNKYFLTNSARVKIENVLELNRIVFLLNEFFNILDGHIVDSIPNESVAELYLLGKANLMESSGVDAYRTYNLIENSLSQAESVKCVMPFFYEPFFDILSELISQEKMLKYWFRQIFWRGSSKEQILKIWFRSGNIILFYSLPLMM